MGSEHCALHTKACPPPRQDVWAWHQRDNRPQDTDTGPSTNSQCKTDTMGPQHVIWFFFWATKTPATQCQPESAP